MDSYVTVRTRRWFDGTTRNTRYSQKTSFRVMLGKDISVALAYFCTACWERAPRRRFTPHNTRVGTENRRAILCRTSFETRNCPSNQRTAQRCWTRGATQSRHRLNWLHGASASGVGAGVGAAKKYRFLNKVCRIDGNEKLWRAWRGGAM